MKKVRRHISGVFTRFSAHDVHGGLEVIRIGIGLDNRVRPTRSEIRSRSKSNLVSYALCRLAQFRPYAALN